MSRRGREASQARAGMEAAEKAKVMTGMMVVVAVMVVMMGRGRWWW